MEDPFFIQRDISYFGAKLRMSDESRVKLERLLAEATQELAAVTAFKE
jgi:hypothetical protein